MCFDDSWEHEVWNNHSQARPDDGAAARGPVSMAGTRTVLIVDVWHPALPPGARENVRRRMTQRAGG